MQYDISVCLFILFLSIQDAYSRKAIFATHFWAPPTLMHLKWQSSFLKFLNFTNSIFKSPSWVQGDAAS